MIDQEDTTRRFASRCLYMGIGTAVTAFVAALTARILVGPTLESYTNSRFFVGLALVAAVATAGSLIVIGGVERLIRPQREATQELRIQMTALTDAVAGMSEQLDAMERRVFSISDYGSGVLDGMQVRADAWGKS